VKLVCEDYISDYTYNLTASHDGWYFFVVDGTGYWDEGDYKIEVRLNCAVAGCGC